MLAFTLASALHFALKKHGEEGEASQRFLGTALLTGVSVVSVVLGLAAQNTLGNLIAGLSLVLYRPFKVGDVLQVNTPRGVVTATVEQLALGYTSLRDADQQQVIVPNSVLAGSVVVRVNVP